jgi:gliding motility-associated-like protein
MKRLVLLLCFFCFFKAQAHLGYTKVITGRKGAESISMMPAFTKYLPDGSVFNLGTFIGCNKQYGIYLSKLDIRGNLKRTTLYTSPGNALGISGYYNLDPQYSNCIYTIDHCFLLLFNYQGAQGVGIIKIDTSGKVIFNEKFANKDYIQLGSVTEDNNGELLLNFERYVRDRYSSVIAKLSSSGEVLWVKNYAMPHEFYFSTSILTMDDGYLLPYKISSSVMYPTGYTRIDKDGNILWSKEVPAILHQPDYHKGIALPDNTFILMGRVEDTVRHSKRKLLLTRIAADGTILSSICYDSIYTGFVNPSSGNLLYINKNQYAVIDENDSNTFIRPFIMTIDTSLNELSGFYYNYGHLYCQTDFDPNGNQYSLLNDFDKMFFYMTENSLITSCPENGISEKGRSVTFIVNDGTVNVTAGALTVDSIKVKSEDVTELLAEYGLCPNTSPVYKSVFPANVVLCKGSSYRLKAPKRTNIGNFFWSTGDTTAYLNISKPGKYWVQFGMLGCVITDTIIARFRPEVKRVSTAKHSYKCPSDTITLSAHSDSVSIAWITPAHDMLYGNTIPAVDSGMYRIVVANAAGCIDIDTVFVHSYPLPNAYAGLDTVICYGSSFTLEGSGGIKYTWTPADYLDNPDIANPKSTPPRTQKYVLFVTNPQGCTSTDTMWLNVRPPLAIKAAGHKYNVCDGTILKDDAVFSGGLKKNYSFSWKNSAGEVIDTFSYLYTPLHKSENYVVTLSDGCSRPVTDTVRITVNPLPDTAFSASDTTGCAPFAVNFSSKDSGNDVYHWTFGDGGESFDRLPVHVYQQAGKYDIKLVITNIYGCIRGVKKQGYITVYPGVKAFFTAEPEKTIISKPEIGFKNNSTGASAYDWNFGDGTPNSNLFESDHKYADTGVYMVKLIASNTFGCMDTFSRRVVVQDLFRSHIPNSFSPNADSVNDVFAPVFTGASSYSLVVYNRWGERLFDNENTSKGWDGRYNGAYAIEGVYLYMITAIGIDGSRHYYHGNMTLLR